MNPWRYFRLDGAEGGEWPANHPLKVGKIIRINLMEGDALPSDAWNDETHDWVSARWVEVGNPAEATS